ncbi:MAG: acyl carrier protein [Candidatus Rokubacteria bacterium]|nr:acyl carrier protein [Candidatus Rokubacteria bacterium]
MTTQPRPSHTVDEHGITVLPRLLARLAETVELPVPVEDITEETGLLGQGLGLDSIEVLSLVAAIEEEFGLTIDDADLKVVHFRTVGALVRFIGERLPRG